MTKQTTVSIGTAVLVIGLGIALFIAQPDDNTGTEHTGMNNNTSAKETLLKPEKTFYDFGTISMKNGKVTAVFPLKNTRADRLHINKVYTSCMCTSAYFKILDKTDGPFGMLGHGALAKIDEMLEPGAEARVEAVFDPNAHGPAGVGVIERTVTIESREGKVAEFNIKATVTP